MESRSSRADTAAARIANAVGPWRFLLVLVGAVVLWCVANTVLQPFHPHPSTMLGYLGTALTVVAVLQGPLILLTQRREAERDRARDIEAFRISQNTEADLHAIMSALERRDIQDSPPADRDRSPAPSMPEPGST